MREKVFTALTRARGYWPPFKRMPYRMRQVQVGCAGWSISRQHGELFGDGDSQLARYATRFSAVEVNSSFYRPHQTATYARWAASVPRNFRFSVKIPRTISHELRLRGTGSLLDQFLGEVEELGNKLGGFLLQLPPSLALDLRVASAFFRAFRHRSDAPLVVEPRHATWFDPRIESLLERYEVSRAGADPARIEAASKPNPAPLWPYWRWHGSPRMYYSEYSEEALRALARDVLQYTTATMPPWVVFDNTAHDFAVANAARLQELLSSGAKARA